MTSASMPALARSGVISRNILTLTAGELLARAIGFAGTVFVARQLGADAYGMVGFGFAVLLYLTTMVDGGLEHTGPREIAEAGEDLSSLVSSVLGARLLSGVIAAALASLVAVGIFDGGERAVLLVYVLALVPIGANLRWVHIGFDRTGLVAASRVMTEGTKALAAFLLVRGEADLLVVPLAQVAGDLAASLLLIGGLRKRGIHLTASVNSGVAVAVLRRGFPMLVTGFLGVVIYNVDVFFLRAFRGLEEVGLYLAAFTLLNFVGIVGHLVTLSLLPTLTRLRIDPAEQNAVYQSTFTRAFAFGLPIAAGASILAPDLIALVFGPAFVRSAGVLSLLIWAIPFVLVRGVAQAGVLSTGRSERALRAASLAAGSKFAINFLSVPLLGMQGAAITTIIAEVVRAAASHRYAAATGFRLPAVARVVRPILGATLMAAVLWLLPVRHAALSVLLGAIVYVATLVMLGAIRLGPSGIRIRL